MKPDQSMLVELALVLLSDMIVEAAASHYTIHKEGSTTRYFYEIIYPLVNSLRPLYASMLLFCLFRCLDEHHIASRLKNTAIKESECAIGLVISFLKMLLARRMYEIVEEPILFKFQILSKLHAALCFSDRKHESYSICEQLIAQYRCISQKYCSSSESRIENRELLDSVEPVYKAALFQYVEDRSNDSLSTGRRLCVQAIEEYPQEAHPWETLALVLHKEDPANNLDDAIVAAKKAFSLNPVNPRVILMLANFYKAQKRYNLYEELLERYRALSTLLENGAKEDEINRMINGIDDLDKTYQPEEEPDQVKLQSAPMREYMNRMEIAHAYSMPIDKEPRVFGEQPVTVPILDPSIISEKGG
ncbi:hypothetical protein ERJ75_001063500 [Trypanosoma vivax]|nr:hypothetical protein ERJ75_001063500 [Trypanosoma vivax]